MKSKPSFEGSFIVHYNNGKRINPLHFFKNNPVPPSPQHLKADPAVEKIKEAIPAIPIITYAKKNKVQGGITDTNHPVQTVKEFTDKYIPLTLLLIFLIFFASCFQLLILFLIIFYLIKIKKRRDTVILGELYS